MKVNLLRFANAINYKIWSILYKFFTLRANFTMANWCRERIKSLIFIKIPSQYDSNLERSLGLAISANLDDEENYKGADLRLALEKSVRNGTISAEFYGNASYILEQKSFINPNLRNPYDDLFLDYIRDRHICVVGPKSVVTGDAQEIDQFDVVVRLNHSFHEKSTDPVFKGLKTDVSYFNVVQAEVLSNEFSGALPEELDWACFKDLSHVHHQINPNTSVRCRQSTLPFFPLFHGSFNMLPLVIMDLAQFATQPIKVFHSDLMLTVERDKAYYPASFFLTDFSKQYSNNVRAFIKHAPALQFRMLKDYWKKNIIYGDDCFNSVMSMDLMEYLSELNAVYGKSTSKRYANFISH